MGRQRPEKKNSRERFGQKKPLSKLIAQQQGLVSSNVSSTNEQIELSSIDNEISSNRPKLSILQQEEVKRLEGIMAIHRRRLRVLEEQIAIYGW